VRGTKAPSELRADRERRSRRRPPTEGAERRPPEVPHRPRPTRRWPGPRTGSGRWEAHERPPYRALRASWSGPGHRPSRIPTPGGFARPGPGRSTDSTGGRRRRRTPRRRRPDGVPIAGTRSTPVATAGAVSRSTVCRTLRQETLDWQPPQGRARLRSPERPRRRAPSTALRWDGRGARATERHRPASTTPRAARTERTFGSTTPLPFPGPGRGSAASVCRCLYPEWDPSRNGPAGDIPLTRGGRFV
jgi:hypothetical protein